MTVPHQIAPGGLLKHSVLYDLHKQVNKQIKSLHYSLFKQLQLNSSPLRAVIWRSLCERVNYCFKLKLQVEVQLWVNKLWDKWSNAPAISPLSLCQSPAPVLRGAIASLALSEALAMNSCCKKRKTDRLFGCRRRFWFILCHFWCESSSA